MTAVARRGPQGTCVLRSEHRRRPGSATLAGGVSPVLPPPHPLRHTPLPRARGGLSLGGGLPATVQPGDRACGWELRAACRGYELMRRWPNMQRAGTESAGRRLLKMFKSASSPLVFSQGRCPPLCKMQFHWPPLWRSPAPEKDRDFSAHGKRTTVALDRTASVFTGALGDPEDQEKQCTVGVTK